MTRAQYDHEVDLGVIEEGEAIELLAGRILEVSPEGSPHQATVTALAGELWSVVGPRGQLVRTGGPVALSDHDEPEPDVAVALPRADGYYNSHPGPDELLLVIEVAHSSHRRDLVLKAGRYALAGIPDYWVVDLVEARTVVHRDPVDGAYRSVEVFAAGVAVTPLLIEGIALQPHLRWG